MHHLLASRKIYSYGVKKKEALQHLANVVARKRTKILLMHSSSAALGEWGISALFVNCKILNFKLLISLSLFNCVQKSFVIIPLRFLGGVLPVHLMFANYSYVVLEVTFFFPFLTFICARVMWRTGNKRNNTHTHTKRPWTIATSINFLTFLLLLMKIYFIHLILSSFN